MNPLLEYIVSELRRVLIDRIVNEFISTMTFRDVAWFILGVICTLLILGMRDMQPEPTVVFFHIDKTGGTTVCDYLACQYPPEQIKPVPVGKRSDFAPNVPTTHSDLYAANRKFSVKPNDRLIMGHYDTGILDYLPKDAVTMTVLRQPVGRVVSLFRYVLENERLYAGLSVDAQNMGLDGWLRKYVDLWDNAMTKQLAGQRWSTGHKEANDAMYAVAVRNLVSMDFVGVTERLSDFLQAVAEGMGWDAPDDKRLNQSASKETAVSDDTLAFIMKHTKYDAMLYGIAIEAVGE